MMSHQNGYLSVGVSKTLALYPMRMWVKLKGKRGHSQGIAQLKLRSLVQLRGT